MFETLDGGVSLPVEMIQIEMLKCGVPWLRLRLLFCEFKTISHHLHFFQLVLLELMRKGRRNVKEAGIGPYF